MSTNGKGDHEIRKRKTKPIGGHIPHDFEPLGDHENTHHIIHRLNHLSCMLCWILPCLLLAFALGVLGTVGFGLLFGWTECNLHGECNDNNACTIDTCVNNVCQFSYPTDGCTYNYECNSHTQLCVDCMCVTTCVPDDCSNSTCSVNTCHDGVCITLKESLPGCCETSEDCYTNSSCVTTECVNNSCQYIPSPDLNWYFDADGDGYGPDVEAIISCEAPVVKRKDPHDRLRVNKKIGGSPGWVNLNGDCNDHDARIFPGSYTVDQCNLIQRLTILNLTNILQTWEPVFWVTTAEQTTEEVTTEMQTTEEVTTESTTELPEIDEYYYKRNKERNIKKAPISSNSGKQIPIAHYLKMIGAVDVLFDFKVIQVKMGRSFSFVTVQAFVIFPGNETVVEFPTAVVVLERDPELTGGWQAVESILCDAASDDPEEDKCNSWGGSLDTQQYNDTIRVVISQHSGDGNQEYAMAQVWEFNITTYEMGTAYFTKLQDLSTSTVPPEIHNKKVKGSPKEGKIRPSFRHRRNLKETIELGETPPVMSDVLVSINQDLIAVGRAGGEVCAGLIDIYRAPDIIARRAYGVSELYVYVDTIYPPDDPVCPVSPEFTFPTDMIVKNQTLFVSAYGYTMDCITTATKGMIFKYIPDDSDIWTLDESIFATIPPLNAEKYGAPSVFYLGTPHISVNENMVLVSSLSSVEVLGNEPPLPPPVNYNSLVSFEPFVDQKTGRFKYMDTYEPVQAFYPEFNYVGGQDFGGSAEVFEINTFSLTNNTIVAWSGYGECNTLHTVTKPGDTWFFGPNLPAPWSSYQGECVDSGLVTDDPNVANYRGLVSTNLLYNLLEVMAVYSNPNPLPFKQYTVPTNESLFEVLIFNCDHNTLC